MEKTKGSSSEAKSGSSKTEQGRGRFKRKQSKATAQTPSTDTLKERVNQHLPLLRPGNVADLITFKSRMADHIRSTFTLNGNCLHTGRYYDGRATMAILTEAKVSLVRMNRPDDQAAEENPILPPDEGPDEGVDLDGDETVEDRSDMGVLLHSLPRETRIKVLDAQLTQGARALIQNRLDSETEKVKIFALLLSKLSEASMALLRNASDSETLLLQANDPVNLWRSIEITHMGGSSNRDTQAYQMLRAYQTIRQDPSESIHRYYERFTEVTSTMETYGVPTDPYFLQARHFLQQLDRTKYGKFLTDLHNLVISGALPGYPRSVLEAYNLAKERVEQNSTTVNNRFANPVVFSTVGDAQRDKKAPKKKEKKAGKAKASNPAPGVCDLCGNPGHFIRTCPRLDAAKEAVSREPSRFTATTFGFEGSQSVFMAHEGMSHGLRDTDILLDTQANVSVFRNEALLQDIRETDNAIQISGFVKGAAEHTSTIGSFLGVEPVYYAPNGAANILSFNQVERGDHNITWVRNSHFDVRFSGIGAPVRFQVRKNGLYVADGSKVIQRLRQAMVTTVAQRESAYPPDQIKRAKQAREIQARLGHVSADALIRSINNGALINVPITAADVLRANEIYGASEARLQGTKRKDRQNPMGILEFIPRPVQVDQVLLADIMQIEADLFLISVSYPLRLTMVALLSDKKATTVASALVDHVEHYKAKGFNVTRIVTDPEATMRAAGCILKQHGVDHDEVGVDQHVARVEVMVKLIKEKTRSILHGLPYRLPNQLTRYAVQYATRMTNAMAPRHSTHGTSPRELFLGRKTDLRRDFKVTFGDYCHIPIYSTSRNTMQPRTIPAISLGGKGNVTGSAEFFVLSTRRVVSRDHWTTIPMPQDAIDFLNSMSSAKTDQVPADQQQDLKIEPVGELPFPTPMFKMVHEADEVDPPDDLDDEHEQQGHNLDEEGQEPVIIQDEGIDEPVPQSVGVIEDIPEAEFADQEASESSDIQTPPPPPEPPPTEAQLSPVGSQDMIPQPRHRPTHLRPTSKRNSMVYNDSYVFNISIAEGIKKHGQVAEASVQAELSQMIAKEVWEPVSYRQVPRESVVIPSFVFLKEKYDASGNFLKVKSRLVAGGHMQTMIAGEDKSSPTASLTAIMMIAAIAAQESRQVLTVDIGGAYLNAPMKNTSTYMMLDKRITDVIGRIDPTYRNYATKKGTTIVRLKKALYGCKESGLLWYETLSEFLKSEGYIANPYDKCVLNASQNGVQITVVIYVDDLMITSNDDNQIEALLNSLRTRFKEISVKRGHAHSYLGMHFTFEENAVTVDMQGYEAEVLAAHDVNGVSTSPASRDLFLLTESQDLDAEAKGKFHTVVAKLAYLAKRTRPDILTAVSFLSTRVQSPTKADESKLSRVLKYLKHTGARSIRLVKQQDYPTAYVDASYGVHADYRSHTGIVITLGQGPIFVRSIKQKINSKSSTEAELIALSDAMGDIIWTRELLSQQQKYKNKFVQQPAIIYEDNQSTLKLLERKKTFAGATKHVNIRYFFIADRAERGEIKLIYKDTKDMLADLLTKPMSGESFITLRDTLMNYSPPLTAMRTCVHVAVEGLCLPEANRGPTDEHDDDVVCDGNVDRDQLSRTLNQDCPRYQGKHNAKSISPLRYQDESTAHENANTLDLTMPLEKKGVVITSN